MTKRNGRALVLDAQRDPVTGRFLTGNRYSIGVGRPKGARTALAQRIVHSFTANLDECDVQAELTQLRKNHPVAFWKCAVWLIRKADLEDVEPPESEEDMRQIIVDNAEYIRAVLDRYAPIRTNGK